MIARYVLGLAVLAGAAMPAAAGIRVDQAEVQAHALVVAGQVSPPGMVTVGIGLQSVIVASDVDGRFVWIGDQVPSSCAVSVFRGVERVRAGVAACGGNPPPVVAATTTYGTTYGAPYAATYGAAGGWRSDQPAPGIGESSWQATTTTQTTTVRRRPTFISPNDPRYPQAEPPHAGRAEVEGTRSGEVMDGYPQRGFYASMRSKEGG